MLFCFSKGGIGGYHGDVVLYIANTGKIDITKIKVQNKKGKDGRDGSNVAPCLSEALQFTYIAERNYDRFLVFWWNEYTGDIVWSNSVVDKYCAREKEYTEYNTVGRKEPIAQPTINIYLPIIEYKGFARQNIGIRVRSTDDFLNEIDKNVDIQGRYDLRGYLKELISYETDFHKLKEHVDYLKLYKIFLGRIDQFITKHQNAISSTDRKALLWMYVTVLSKIFSLQTEVEPTLITDISGYLEIVMTNIRKLDGTSKKMIVNEHKLKYKKDIDIKIQEAEDSINELLLPMIDSCFKSIDLEMDRLINEIQNRQEELQHDITQLRASQKSLRFNNQLKDFLGLLRHFIPFIGSLFKSEDSIIGPIISIMGSPYVMDENNKFAFPSMTVSSPNGSLLTKIETIESVIRDFKVKINELSGNTAINTEIIDLEWKLDDEKSALNPLSTGHVDEFTKNLIKKLTQMYSEFMQHNETQAAQLFNQTSDALSVILGGLGGMATYNRYKNDTQKIKIIADSLKAAENQYEELQTIESKIWNRIRTISGSQSYFNDFADGLKQKDQTNFDVSRIDIQEKLGELKRILARDVVNYVKGLHIETKIVELVGKLSNIIDLLIEIHHRIQNYGEQKKLVAYIADINTADFRNIRIDDEELKTDIAKLENSMSANLILAQYYSAVNGFKQIAFPFAASYLSEYSLPHTLQPVKNVSELVETIRPHLESLQLRIQEYNLTGINHNDKFIYTGLFSSQNTALGPFYVWQRAEHAKAINDLLSGKRIYIRAEVAGGVTLNAIKFNSIGIEFRANNSEVESHIKNVLKRFHVILTHTGMSYYRCDKQYFAIESMSQVIAYSFDTNNGQRVSQNSVYEKLERGQMLLSPYTLWAMQLEGNDFSQLSSFRGLVDVELYGRGQYLKTNAAICASNLKEFYHLDETPTES